MNKKGVSPLVATVLLIAFAVSLGAVVMNWTSGPHEEPGHGSEAGGIKSVCEEVQFSILNKGADKAICLDRESNELVIDLENGPVALDGLRLSYLATESGFIDHNERIEVGILSHITVDYDVVLLGELQNIRIVPFVYEEDVLYCPDQGQFFSEIADC